MTARNPIHGYIDAAWSMDIFGANQGQNEKNVSVQKRNTLTGSATKNAMRYNNNAH
jgi:hypothetical protein